MATKQFFHDIDLVKVGQLVDARIQNVTDAEETALAGSLGGTNAGLVVYNTTTSTMKIWDGAEFKSVSSDIDGDIIFKGTINPTNLASKVSSAAKGHQFVADVAADLTIGSTTHEVEVGDIVLFTHDEGQTVEATVFNRNIDAASVDQAGIVELATADEVSGDENGVYSTTHAITPASFAGSQWASDIAQNAVDISANASEIDDLEAFVGEGTALSTTATTLADAVNELKDRADSADGEIDALEAFAGEGVTLKTQATTLATAINELVDADSDASDRSAAIEADVATLQTNTGDVTTLVTDDKTSLVVAINELHGEIDQNASDIATNAAAIQSNAQDIATNLQAITDNDSDILSLQVRVDLVEINLNDVVDNSTLNLQTQIDDNDSDILSLQTQVTANDGELSTLQSEMDAVEGRATALELADSAQDVRLDALETEQSAQAGRLTVNEGDIDALELAVGTVGDLDTTATDLVAAINEIHGEADALDVRMGDAEDDVDALELAVGTITDLSADFVATDLVGAVNELQAEIIGNDSDITSLEGRATALEARDNIGSYTTTMNLATGAVNPVTHNLALAAANGFVANVIDSDGHQISVDIEATNTNAIGISTLAPVSNVTVTVMGLKA
jgi:predicted  nucleic acid-binding Zn-ribbon protein